MSLEAMKRWPKREVIPDRILRTLLIANRGEVAGRIISTCKRLGIRTVAIFSEMDRDSLYTRMADEAFCVGPAPAQDSYLNMEAILKVARLSGADAVHPGYGFLAENAEFARRVRDMGLIFVGPKAEVIEQMGSKVRARELCQATGVPTVPGSGALDDDALLAWADSQGYPVMLKASAGGGGKGMRRLGDSASLKAALASSRREAVKAFGSDEIYLEKALVQARHLEVQILGDEHGRLAHLGVRECSLQRRHQKILEESPPSALSQALFDKLTQSALKLAEAVQYTSLGTVEFLVLGDDFYFLEMNTRLQVEHPVTEMITGLDLVELQLDIAQGEKLPFTQQDLRFHGHAMEARITCEDPSQGFLPATGTILEWRPYTRTRYDATLEVGQQVSPHYDSMVAKVIAWGETRDKALRQLRYTLQSTVLLGVTHNIDFLVSLLETEAVKSGRVHTELVESLPSEEPQLSRVQLLAATAVRWAHLLGPQQALSPLPVSLEFEGQPPVTVCASRFQVEGEDYSVHIGSGAVEIDGRRVPVVAARQGRDWWLHTPEGSTHLIEVPRLPLPQALGGGSGSLQAPMPGSVVEVLVKPGDRVEIGQTLLKLEAMKMEHVIAAPYAGFVESILFQAGEQVDAGQQLLVLAPRTEADHATHP